MRYPYNTINQQYKDITTIKNNFKAAKKAEYLIKIKRSTGLPTPKPLSSKRSEVR
jgi:hypothetical protein